MPTHQPLESYLESARVSFESDGSSSRVTADFRFGDHPLRLGFDTEDDPQLRMAVEQLRVELLRVARDEIRSWVG